MHECYARQKQAKKKEERKEKEPRGSADTGTNQRANIIGGWRKKRKIKGWRRRREENLEREEIAVPKFVY